MNLSAATALPVWLAYGDGFTARLPDQPGQCPRSPGPEGGGTVMRIAPVSGSGLLSIVLAVLAGLALAVTSPRQAVAARSAASSASSSESGLAGYYHQRLTWQPCPGSADDTITCAVVKVPLSYADPAGPSISLMIDRLPAGTPGRHPILLTNPGGPGGQGLPTPGQLRTELPASVLNTYDIIGSNDFGDPVMSGSGAGATDCHLRMALPAATGTGGPQAVLLQ